MNETLRTLVETPLATLTILDSRPVASSNVNSKNELEIVLPVDI
jgi:hypothetical protein